MDGRISKRVGGGGQCEPAHALRWTRGELREVLHKVLNILSASIWQYMVQMASEHRRYTWTVLRGLEDLSN